MRLKRSPLTATSASWTVMALACRTTRAPILIERICRLVRWSGCHPPQTALQCAKVVVLIATRRRERQYPEMMIGVDLAKNDAQVHGARRKAPAVHAALASGRFVPHCVNPPLANAALARMAAMRKLRRGIGHIGQRPLWAGSRPCADIIERQFCPHCRPWCLMYRRSAIRHLVSNAAFALSP